MPFFGRERATEKSAVPLRLHLGCGQSPIPGWLNIDVQHLPGVDRVLDVRRGLPFENVAAIYGEHFLEHLELEEGLACLVECRRALAPEGILRVSTPNHGWGHRFLYNRQALEAALSAAGFSKVTMHRYGESDVAELAGLERHEKSGDTAELPHVLIAQASGRGKRREMSRELLEDYRQALEAH